MTVSLASATATAEQTECATAIITNELAAEQLLVQVSGLEPSAELLAAREALNGCSPTDPRGPQNHVCVGNLRTGPQIS